MGEQGQDSCKKCILYYAVNLERFVSRAVKKCVFLERIVFITTVREWSQDKEVGALCSQASTVIQGRDDESLIWGSGKSKDWQIWETLPGIEERDFANYTWAIRMRKTQGEISLKVPEDGASVLKDQNHERSEFGRKNNYLDYIYVTLRHWERVKI